MGVAVKGLLQSSGGEARMFGTEECAHSSMLPTTVTCADLH